MSTIPVTPASVSSAASLARKGLDDMSRARDNESRKSVGDRYLASISSDAQSSELERLLAQTARAATQRQLYSSTSAVNAQRVALNTISAGVSGPFGPVLAAMARQVLEGAYNNDDRRKMACPFLDTLASRGQPLEQELAGVAADAASQKLYSNTTATQANAAAFSLLEAGLVGSSESAVAGYGRQIMKTAYNVDDRWIVGDRVLRHLGATGCPESRIVADVARQASRKQLYSRTSAVAAQEKALELLVATPSGAPDAVLTQLGQHVLAHAYNGDDKSILGRAVLDGISANVRNGTLAAVAAAVSAATGQSLHSSSSKVNLLAAAFTAMAALPASQPLEHTLAKVGMECHKAGYNADDKDLMGAALLHEIGARTTDRRVKTQVAYARQALEGSTDHNANLQTQAGAFDSILSGRNVVTVALRGVHMSLQLPLIDDETPPDRAKTELDACVPHNREVMNALDLQERQYADSISALQADLKKLEDEEAAREAAAGPIRKRVQILARAHQLSMLPAVGGILGAITTGSPIALGIAVAGAAAWVVLGKKLLTATRAGKALRGHDFEFKKIMARVQVDSAQSKLDAVKAAMRQAEPLHRPLDERYRLIEMTQFVQGTMPDPNATVELEDQFVNIGGLRVPRNVAGSSGPGVAVASPLPGQEAGLPPSSW